MHIRNLAQRIDITYVIKDEWHLPVHKHTHYELQYIMRGKGLHTINDQSYCYEKGDLFILAPQDTHFFTFGERSVICIIKFHKSYFDAFLQDDEFKNLLESITTPYRKNVPSGRNKAQISQLMELVIAGHRRETAYQQLTIKSALALVLTLYAKAAAQNHIRQKDQKIQAILHYIDQYITQKSLLSIQHIADTFHISGDYFNQYFKRATGNSYKKYVQEYTLTLIAHQLVYSDKTLNQLAQEFGYSDESHLSNAFKAFFKKRPSLFKKEKRQSS